MNFAVIGGGAIGGLVAAQLWRADVPVVLVARPETSEAVRLRGLKIEAGTDSYVASTPVVDRLTELKGRFPDVLIVAVKSQHTSVVIHEALEARLPRDTVVLSAQNGVENELALLRVFNNTFGAMVQVPAVHTRPGVVVTSYAPIPGVLDVGSISPSGSDSIGRRLVSTFRKAGFLSVWRGADIMSWKRAKLLRNAEGAPLEIVGDRPHAAEIGRMVRKEATAAYDAAGLDWTDDVAYAERRGELDQRSVRIEEERVASSLGQSLLRRTLDTEVDYINGEIVRLGRLWAVPTPANLAVQLSLSEMALSGQPPRSMSAEAMKRVIIELSGRS